MLLQLSIVIAAFNEALRLPGTLSRMKSFLDRAGISYEFMIVDDGSTDQTLDFLRNEALKNPQLRYLTHSPNRGRGTSIREGVFAAAGEYILETDADGSVADEAIARFLDYFEAHQEVDALFGSRQLPESKIAYNQPMLRVILGYGFIYLARILFGMWRTTDFTLGFKMFRREAARDIFSHQYDPHYLAEAETAYAAKRRGWATRELPVTWTDNRDSRVRPIRESLRSLKGMLKILLRDFRGAYTKIP